MITVKDVLEYLWTVAPEEGKEPWDNVGHLVGRLSAAVTKILVALDCTWDVVKEAEQLGAELIVKAIDALPQGTLTPEKQDDALSCYASMITKQMSALDFAKSALELHRVICALTGFTTYEGKRLKVYRSLVASGTTDAAPGTIIDADTFTVACGDGTRLTFTEVQLEGSKRMQTADFLRGKKLTQGAVLGA